MKSYECKNKIHIVEHFVEEENQEITRLSLKAGQNVPEHKSDMTAVVVPVKGKINFCAGSDCEEIYPGKIIRMTPGEMHKLEAIEDSEIIVIKSDLK